MPINVFGDSSNNSESKNDRNLFFLKPYLRTNYIEADIEEDNNMKRQFKIENSPCFQENSDAVFKSYVGNIFKNGIDLNDVKLENKKFDIYIYLYIKKIYIFI